MALLDPEADAVVLEIRPDDVLRYGLGCDAVNVTAVVNADAPGGQGPALAPPAVLDAIRVVARSTRDTVHVGDADPCGTTLERDTGRARLCRVHGRQEDRRRAAPAVADAPHVVQEGSMTAIDGVGAEQGRVLITELLHELSGMEPASATQCALHAVAAASSLGMKPREIHRALRGFRLPPKPVTRRRRKRSRSA
jgi:hypothetical protein